MLVTKHRTLDPRPLHTRQGVITPDRGTTLRRVDSSSSTWARRLTHLAGGTLRGPAWEADAAPDVRAAELDRLARVGLSPSLPHRAILARVLRVPPGPAPRDLADDAVWWWALHSPGPPPSPPPGRGPLLPRLEAQGLEIWTQAELSALHALWNASAPGDALRARCLLAAGWLIREVQPDNATLLPWAVHVFVLGSHTDLSKPEALHYADTLVHNAIAGGSLAAPLAGAILLDAARALGAP
jgi:hypothetical protein